MKKRIELFLILSIALISTGCMKMEVSMGIHKDKSMDFSMIQAIDMEAMSQFGDAGATTTNEMTEEEIKEMEETSGFKVEEYKEDSFEGYKMTKTFANIDKISNEEEIETDLSALTSTEEDEQQFFQVKRGLFKNTYKAKLKSSDSEDMQDQIGSSEDSSELQGFDTSSLTSQLDFNLSVNLPYKAISSNAMEVTNDGKTLVWNLLELKDEAVEFEFELYNTTVIYVTLGITIGFILVLIILVLITLRGNKKRRQKELSENVEVDEQPEVILPIQDINIQQPQFNQGMPTVSPAELNPNMTSAVEMNLNVQNINNDYYNNMQ